MFDSGFGIAETVIRYLEFGADVGGFCYVFYDLSFVKIVVF